MSESPARPAVVAGTAAAGPHESELRRLLLEADLVVLGEVRVPRCLDGCLGSVKPSEVLRGTAAGELAFVTAPADAGIAPKPARRVVFLQRELGSPGRWRLILTPNREYGLDPSLAERVRTLSVPSARLPAERAPFARDLAALRAHDQTQWNGQPIVDPARRVFENLDFRGLRPAELTSLIGTPVRKEPRLGHEVWFYTFHDGEQGVLPQVWWGTDGHVQRVTVLYGQ